MKLVIDNKREFLQPEPTIVVAAIKSLKYDSTLLLEDGADFVNCWTEHANSFQFQYQDGKTLQIFDAVPERISYDELLSIFLKFLAKDDSWKTDHQFKLADFQVDLDLMLKAAETKPVEAPAEPLLFAKEPVAPPADTEIFHQQGVVVAPPAQPTPAPFWLRGAVNEKMLCPHCSTRGHVQTKKETRKAGVSGGKATGALLTAGLSLFVTGLSRKETVTAAYCGNCEAEWSF